MWYDVTTIYQLEMKKNISIPFQIFLWLTVPFILTFFVWVYQYTTFLPGIENEITAYGDLLKKNFLISVITTSVGAFGFYFTFYYVVPSVYGSKDRKKILLFLTILLVVPFMLIVLLGQVFLAVYFFIGLFIMASYIILVPFSIFGALLKVYNDLKERDKEKVEIEKKNIETQLMLIKAKIDPHFLFNTINNIDVLIDQDPEKASEFIKRLSRILRFTLYHTDKDRILLEDEVNYLMEYIELQRIRSVNPNFVKFEIKGSYNGLMIAPMVLISFIENAFKFVAKKDVDNSIEISIDISAQTLTFKCQNSFIYHEKKKERRSGIGISSIKERLKILYKNSHDLKISSENGIFIVLLKIDLND